MSCDFGPIPFPTPPMQTYYEEQYFSRNSIAGQSRPASVSKPESGNLAPQLIDALEKVAEGQRHEEGDGVEVEQVVVRKPTTHRRGQSLGQRLLSGGLEWWSTLSGDQGNAQKVGHTVELHAFPLCMAVSDL